MNLLPLEFIKQLNKLGASKTPFLCLIDFEMEKPLIFELEKINSTQLLYQFGNISNVDSSQIRKVNGNTIFEKHPVSFDQFSTAFKKVKKGLDYGDSYLVNLTCPTHLNTNASFKDIFHNSIQPFKLWLKDEFVVFSPERFIKIRENKIHTFPMKGTIDASIPNAEQIILDSKKEAAEHATITDLLRNDLSKVACNVKVEKYRYTETIKTLHKDLIQVSSHISGDLSSNWQSKIGDILAELLPAGSISGAPKDKTVQIIQDAEQEKRGYYTGIMGLFDGTTFDSAVMIRYIEQKGSEKIFRSGGGITFLSKAEEEYQEMIDKVYLPWRSNVF